MPAKKIIALIGIWMMFSSNVSAASLKVQDPCSDNLWLDQDRSSSVGQSVGAVTVAGLNQANISFVGDAQGVSSINGTVFGNAAIEVIATDEMRAYGWCFELNGVAPDKMPGEVIVTSESDRVYWYFGYAHYKGGQWLTYCSPTHREKPAFICAP